MNRLDTNHLTATTADDAVLTGDDGDGVLQVHTIIVGGISNTIEIVIDEDSDAFHPSPASLTPFPLMPVSVPAVCAAVRRVILRDVRTEGCRSERSCMSIGESDPVTPDVTADCRLLLKACEQRVALAHRLVPRRRTLFHHSADVRLFTFFNGIAFAGHTGTAVAAKLTVPWLVGWFSQTHPMP
jgi:hypothetical protein